MMTLLKTLSRSTTGIIWNFAHFPLALHFPPIMLIGLGLGVCGLCLSLEGLGRGLAGRGLGFGLAS